MANDDDLTDFYTKSEKFSSWFHKRQDEMSHNKENFESCDICGKTPCACTLDLLKMKLRDIRSFLERNGVKYDIPRGMIYEDTDFKFAMRIPTDLVKLSDHETISINKNNGERDYNAFSASSDFSFYQNTNEELKRWLGPSKIKSEDFYKVYNLSIVESLEEIAEKNKKAVLKELMEFMDKMAKELGSKTNVVSVDFAEPEDLKDEVQNM